MNQGITEDLPEGVPAKPHARGLSWLAALPGLFFLCACTTFPAHTERDETYAGKLTQAQLVWSEKDDLITRFHTVVLSVAPSAPVPVLASSHASAREPTRAQRYTNELLALFRAHARPLVAQELQGVGVTVVSDGQTAVGTARVLLEAESFAADCSALYCVYSLWLNATVYDDAHSATTPVWRGRFKSGQHTLPKNDKTVVESFARSLVAQLKYAEILK